MRNINRLSFLAAVAIMGAAQSFRMADDALAATGQAPTAAPDAPVNIAVPAEHESAVQRFVDLLKSGEQWIVDNVHAALTHFESFLTSADDTAETQKTDE